MALLPPTELNAPPTYTEVPSVVSEFAAPPRFGLNAASITPVVASKAKIRFRTTSSPVLPKVPDGLTDVKVPAAMILLPTCTIALTEPFITCGVTLTGSAETTWLPWSVLTATAGRRRECGRRGGGSRERDDRTSEMAFHVIPPDRGVPDLGRYGRRACRCRPSADVPHCG